jgi:hypothetical protein
VHVVRGIAYPRSVHNSDDRDEPADDPFASADAARHVAHLTGMTPESAKTYAAFVCGRWAHGPAEKPAG